MTTSTHRPPTLGRALKQLAVPVILLADIAFVGWHMLGPTAAPLFTVLTIACFGVMLLARRNETTAMVADVKAPHEMDERQHLIRTRARATAGNIAAYTSAALMVVVLNVIAVYVSRGAAYEETLPLALAGGIIGLPFTVWYVAGRVALWQYNRKG